VAAECGAGVLQEAWALDGGGTDDDVGQACVDVALDRVEIADTAAELHGDVFAALGCMLFDGFQDAFDGREVLRFASEGAIQIHKVQSPRARFEPSHGHFDGVAEDRGLVHVTLFESDGLAVFEVDSRDKKHDQYLKPNAEDAEVSQKTSKNDLHWVSKQQYCITALGEIA
jgi:hypothetical protein